MNWNDLAIKLPQIMLPKTDDMHSWAVVACDQYTSEPEYWQRVEKSVSGKPSALQLMLPEIYLEKEGEKERIEAIKASMKSYLSQGMFNETAPGAVLVRRTVSDRMRKGLILALDLERYDYSVDSSSLIRATEGTIIQRIPPRLRIRGDALIEMPHIIILIDDESDSVLSPLAAMELENLYDFELMEGGGHIQGQFIPEDRLECVRQALSALFKNADGKHQKAPLLYAVGDGNHSLATAKASWEKIKKSLNEAQIENHPARYALCEIENLHDQGIVFEPIHRVLFNCGENALEEIASIIKKQNNSGNNEHIIKAVRGQKEFIIKTNSAISQLEVGTLQNALDEYLSKNANASIDYIHGEDITRALGEKEGCLGFLLPVMAKQSLFDTVILDGALPRKTFSMGEAHEKRFYLEMRRITE